MGSYDGGRFAISLAVTLKGSSHMTLLSSLLQQLESPNLSRDQSAELRCQLAKGLEDAGDYEAARQVLGEFWQYMGERPRVEGLDQRTAAEVLLRVGVLTGWIGSKQQIADAQETAKDFISESVSTFESFNYGNKILEARVELALCYWREGSYDEARIMLNDVLAELTANDELKAKAILRLAIVERSSQRLNEALQILIDNAEVFEGITNHTLKGSYHNNLANLWEDIGKAERREDYTDRAFVEYAAASYYFEQAEHKSYHANVENNLGYLYFKSGKYKEAHEHLDRARRIVLSLKDNYLLGQFEETRARVFLCEGRNTEAEKTARAAVELLEQSDQQDLLAEALIAHGTALARLGFYSQSYATLQHAIETAQQAGALGRAGEAALILIEELGEHLNPRKEKTSASRTLVEEVRRYEYDLIRRALEATRGSVTRAAKMLGVTHQRLIYIIEKRHKDLRSFRTPAKRRYKSIIKPE
ncbi:MAG TPA: tetratricopeptide repeat protein [Pyrinomonadaceae bacterium]|nr:tetratricopeptide repeat protein [Pyrinomonadaceae bacterium]